MRRRSGNGDRERETSHRLEGSNGVLAVAQVVEWLPNVARRVQACPAHKYVRPAIAHFRLEQLLHLALGHAVRPTSESPPRRSGRRRYMRRRSTLNTGKMRHVAGMSSQYVFGVVRARPRKGPIHRWESSERDRRCVCSVSRSSAAPRPPQRTARPAGSRREASSSCLRRAGALLQQRQHFRSHVPHQVRGSLAGPCWVGCSRGVQGAARMLAAGGVEGRVAGAEGRG